MENKYPYIKQYLKFIKDENLEDGGFDKEIQNILIEYFKVCEERDYYRNIVGNIELVCMDELYKSNKELRRIDFGFINPYVSVVNLAKGCEYDIQKVLNSLLKTIHYEEEDK